MPYASVPYAPVSYDGAVGGTYGAPSYVGAESAGASGTVPAGGTGGTGGAVGRSSRGSALSGCGLFGSVSGAPLAENQPSVEAVRTNVNAGSH